MPSWRGGAEGGDGEGPASWPLGSVMPRVSSVQAILRGQRFEHSGDLAHPTYSVSVPSNSALGSHLLK